MLIKEAFSLISLNRLSKSDFFGDIEMAKNAPYGDNARRGMVRERSQTQTPSGHWVKRDANTGRFMDVKQDGTPFKGVRKEK